jgi:hypothetical protein
VVIIIAFLAVWLTLPGDNEATPWGARLSGVSYPAKLFRFGLQSEHEYCSVGGQRCGRVVPTQFVNQDAMKNHALVFFGGLAAIVLLLGVAFGAASRKTPPPSVEAE